MTEPVNRKERWWLRELLGIAFKLHPVVLLSLGLLNANEAFLVLAVSYLVPGLFSLVKSTFIIGYELVAVRFPETPSLSGKIGETFTSLLGWGFMLLINGFLLLLMIGLLYDAVERQDYQSSVFDGKAGAVLVRTLLINGAYFIVLESIRLVRFIRNYRIEQHNVFIAWFFCYDFHQGNKWAVFPMVWLVLCYVFFLFMLTGQAFEAAIWSFFIFDIGFAFLDRVRERKLQRLS